MSKSRGNKSGDFSGSTAKSDEILKPDDLNRSFSDFVTFIPDEDIDESLEEWKYSLIGRLDLVKLKFWVAESSLRRQWKTSSKFQLIRIGKGYFIIKLENELYMNLIWNGDWEVESQYLKLRKWEPNFNPETHKTSTAYICVQLPGISIKYCKEKILMNIGKALGRPVKVDETTLKKEARYYANILVEMDLAKQIPSKICVKSKYGIFGQAVNIPNRPKFCYHCKIVGHYTGECRNKSREQESSSSGAFPALSVEKLLREDAAAPAINNTSTIIPPISRQASSENVPKVKQNTIHGSTITTRQQTANLVINGGKREFLRRNSSQPQSSK
ncbi:uncharacterized protein LOC113324912 [Papaver somniferum]|uniref:uncharacterized protein LOC113324912 n=1 Tax=Papaver somniferum TaxID=3469 RepID=UPI000E6FCA1D|nr:uncharacterized protein LOC113324912 [Papaver somniferum]